MTLIIMAMGHIKLKLIWGDLMKFILGFFFLAYVFMFFYPKFTVSINGVPTNSFTMRILGALSVAVLLTVFIGLPLLGVISIFT